MSSFDGLRVLEFSGRVAGAFCGKLLAGFGADVIRIPGGHTPLLDDDERTWLHTAKREARLDPTDHVQRAALEVLIRNADIVIDAWGIDLLSERGLGAQHLRQLNPQLVLCQVTPFGQSGPRRAWRADDITLYAASGLMWATGDGAREPLNARPRVCEVTAGMSAYIACLMALVRRNRDGIGEVIDLSIHESALENLGVEIGEFLARGKVARRNDDEHELVPWRTYPCADGHAAIIGGPIRRWLAAARTFGIPALLEPRLGGMDDRIRHRAEFEALIAPWLKQRTRSEILRLGQREGVAWSYLASLPDAIRSPQNVGRGFLVEIEQAGRGSVRLPGAPFRAARSAWRDGPAPSAAMLADQVVSAWSGPRGFAGARAARRAGDVAAPLHGVRVLDFTHDASGPHAARVLADFGAEVIKIEYPKRLDGTRGSDVARIDEEPRFWQLHRGKKSLTLDLALDRHRRVLESVAKGADIVIENSRPGVMARMGFGYERVRALKPDVIFVAMSAFGATGPHAGCCGYAGTLEALSGLQSLTGYDAESPSYRIRAVEAMNGLMGACAAMTALVHRQRTGEGQWIDLSQCETTGWFIGEHLMRAARTGEQPAAVGNRSTVYAPQGCYAASGEDRWFVLSVRSDEQWRSLAQLIGRESLASDPRFLTALERRARHGLVDALIGDWARKQEPELAVEALQDLGIAAAQVCTVADLASDPHLAEREWFQQVGGGRFPGFPFRLANGGARIAARGPKLGSANVEFFGLAGIDTLPDLGAEWLGTAYALI